MRVCLETYGCTLNQADSDIMKGVLISAGHSIVEKVEDADVAVLNTCTVKGKTENKIVSRIESLWKKRRRVVVAGCLSINRKRVRDACPEAVLLHPGAVAGVADAVEDAAAGRITEYPEPAAAGNRKPGTGNLKEGLPRIFTRPILRIPIQEGCVGNCHFCQTKLARPKLMSYSVKWIRGWVEEGVAEGAREIQLTGMDSGAYGLDTGPNLVELLSEIGKVKGDFRIRMGMINPSHAKRMLPGLMEVFSSGKFYKFFHLPVQTGSEKVRKEMNRAHSVEDFRDVVRGIRKEFPDASIATDIIVGYPTETEGDFQETVELVETIRPDIVNVSKFASRRGTHASRLKEIPTQEVKRRSTLLSEVVKRVAAEKNEGYHGRVLEVLVTEEGKPRPGNRKQGVGNRKLETGNWKGRAPNYKQVCMEGELEPGQTIKVRIDSSNYGSLFGKRA